MRSSKDILFVGAQGVLFLLFVALPSGAGFYSGLEGAKLLWPILFSGGVIVLHSIWQMHGALSPFPSPKRDAELISSGLFKFVRHPIYSGILILVFSWSFYANESWKLAISLALLFLFYFKSEYEEKLLLEKYEAYAAYRERTGRFLPKVPVHKSL